MLGGAKPESPLIVTLPEYLARQLQGSLALCACFGFFFLSRVKQPWDLTEEPHLNQPAEASSASP